MPKINLTRAITVNLDTGEQVKLPAGGSAVTDEVADHWFVKAHMVKDADVSESTEPTKREEIDALEVSLSAAHEQIDQLTTNLQNASASIFTLQSENLDLRAAKSQRESELEAQVAELQQRLEALNAVQSAPVQPVSVDYAAMTVDQIKALLTEKGISFNSRDTKFELIALLG